jgi:hypothetical protein
MNPFKPFTDMASGVTGLIQSAHAFMEKAGGEGFGKGFKGVIQDVFDLNAVGLREQVDASLGTGVMHLTIAGNTENLETVARFRNHAFSLLDDLIEMRDITNAFVSKDITEANRAVDQMSDFLDEREPPATGSERERLLEQEIEKLRKIIREMNNFLNSEEGLLAEEKAEKEDASAAKSVEPAAAPAEPPERTEAVIEVPKDVDRYSGYERSHP